MEKWISLLAMKSNMAIIINQTALNQVRYLPLLYDTFRSPLVERVNLQPNWSWCILKLTKKSQVSSSSHQMKENILISMMWRQKQAWILHSRFPWNFMNWCLPTSAWTKHTPHTRRTAKLIRSEDFFIRSMSIFSDRYKEIQ